METAEAPTRDEIIVIGVDTAGDITAQLWDGTDWNDVSGLPGGLPSTLASGVDSQFHAFDVAYESVSGQALMVWSKGTNVAAPFEYSVWDGATWSAVQDFNLGLLAVERSSVLEMRLVADPTSDEMVLVVSNANERGCLRRSLGRRHRHLGRRAAARHQLRTRAATTTAGTFSSSIEQLSGRRGGRLQPIATPSTPTCTTKSGTVAGDRNRSSIRRAAAGLRRACHHGGRRGSNRLAIGVLTTQSERGLACRLGRRLDLGYPVCLGQSPASANSDSVAVAFESQSGQLLATYAESERQPSSTAPGAVSGTGWSGSPAVQRSRPRRHAQLHDPGRRTIRRRHHAVGAGQQQ